MKKLILFLFGVFLFSFTSQSQCPTASFINPGTLCSGSPSTLTNASTGASAYQWDFCGGDFKQPYSYAVDNPSTPNGPSSINLVYDSTNWYGFLFNYYSMTITRYDFGSSLDNTPDSNDLGNLGGAITGGAFWNDMSFVKEDSNWYGIFSLYGAAEVVLVSFGPHLNNPNPVASVYSNGSFHSLAFQDLKNDNGNLYMFIARDGSGQIFRLNYGNSITNAPTMDVINLSGSYDELGDISLVKYCDHWYGFVTSLTTGSIVRLDFGNSLSNSPSFIDLGNPNGLLFQPWSMRIAYDGDQWYAFEVNFLNNFNRIDFGKDLTNISPAGISLNYPNINGVGASVNVAKMNSAFYLFLCNRNGDKFSKVKYEAPCGAIPQIATQTNPVVDFTNGGTYILSLAATDSVGNVNYYSDSINVNYAPTPNFSFQNTCFNDITTFQDSSFFAQGTITGRLWDFGDTTTSSSVSPTHRYAFPGKYPVSLTLNGSLGCNAVYTDTVTIGAIPSVAFSVNPGCSNIPISFLDSSTVGFSNTIVNWYWDFGDNDTSTLQNPVYKYPFGGTYPVTLTATTNYNCSTTYQMNITVQSAPKAGFIVSNTCLGGTVVFTDTSTINNGTINSWRWNFGDADTSVIQNTSHSYVNSVATYTVSMVASAADGCSDTATVPIKINNTPVPSFSFLPVTICEGDDINLNDLSTVAGDTIYAWHWNFGDGDSSSLKNPSHSYASPGSYTIVLTAYSQTSCGSSASDTVTVIASPTAVFVFTASCLGDSTYFTDSSTPPSGATIVARHWDFGDGDTSNLTNPAHYYDSAGTYSVNLVITDNIGCTNTFGSSVRVHEPPITAFTDNLGCTSAPVGFFDGSTSADGAINTYSWDFGDPSSGSSDSSNSAYPTHTYYTAGVYVVTLTTGTIYGCSDTEDSLITINQSSAANFQYLPTCQEAQMVFTNLDSLPNLDSLWSWSFGDGGASFISSPSHYYLLPGIYSVTLSVTSTSGCINSITKPVEVSYDPVAAFVPAPACLNATYSLQDISTVASGLITHWQWTFDNGDTSNIMSPGVTYSDTGDYTISLTVTSASGCVGDTTETIHVYPLPTANFNYNPLFGSPPLQVNFNNLSTGAAIYLWQFGDGDSSTATSPSYTYQDTGKFNIIQIAYSDEGCVDSITKTIYVIKPRLDIAVTGISYQLQNNLFSISAQVENLGTEDIDNYVLQASIQGGATIDDYINTPLPSGAQGIFNYSFPSSFQVTSDEDVNYYCVSALQPNGETDDNPANNEKCATITNQFTVVQPYPNPFSDYLQLQFILPTKGQVTVDLLDMLGQEISILYNNEANEGGTTVQVPTATLVSEVYFCRFTFKNQTLIYPLMKAPDKK